MKQITPEIKVRIAALYYGQKIMQTTIKNNPSDLSGIMLVEPMAFIPPGSQYFLNVVPLSSITDEDAIECLNLMLMKGYSFKTLMEYADHNKYGNEQKVNYFKRNIPYYMDSSRLVDHLRSKGYALPYMDWSVDELVSEGVFKLKEANND